MVTSLQHLRWLPSRNGVLVQSREHAETMASCAMRLRPGMVRDVACIHLMWTAGLRSDELVRLAVRDILINDDGATLLIRSSKTDQEGRGTEKVIPRGKHASPDPVILISAWLEVLKAAGCEPTTPVFVSIDRHDNLVLRELQHDDTERVVSPVRPQTMTNVIRDALRVAGCLDGVDVSAFSSHSAKRGIATELAHHDADVRQIMSVTGHKNANGALGYVEKAERFSQSPLRMLDL